MKSGENMRKNLSEVMASMITMMREKTESPITMSLNRVGCTP